MMEEVKKKRQREARRLITICNFCVYCMMQLVSELQVREQEVYRSWCTEKSDVSSFSKRWSESDK